MALSIKTAEADRLELLETRLQTAITDAITIALRERLARERARHEAAVDLPARIAAFSRRIRDAYDTRPVTKAEWDAASGDEE